MNDPFFLSMEDVLAVHERMIQEFGGVRGIREMGLLESAVMMPMASHGGSYLHESIPAMCGAYLFHICKNHALLDGNTRTALACAEVFAMLNGFRLDATDKELETITLAVASGELTKSEATKFFEQSLIKDTFEA